MNLLICYIKGGIDLNGKTSHTYVNRSGEIVTTLRDLITLAKYTITFFFFKIVIDVYSILL